MYSKSKKLKISVCIATYNGEKYILKQLMSILSQLKLDDEVIISDDGSNDRTKEIIRSLNDSRIILIDNIYKKGYTNNFLNALEKASGDIIFISDQDDIWVNNKVEYCLNLLCDSFFVVSNAIVIDSEENIINNSFFSISKPFKSRLGNLYRFSYLGCCMCFRKEVLELAIPFPKNQKLCTHDNWLFLIGIFYFKIKITNVPLVLYRRHGNNTSSGAEQIKKRNSLYFMLKYRVYLIIHLMDVFVFKYLSIKILGRKSLVFTKKIKS